MKTVEDAVRELGGDWRKAIEPGGDYLWAIGDIWQALDSPTGYFGEFICTREEFDECKAKLEGKSMKLIDILARDLEWWPKSFGYVAQDRRRMGHIKPVLWAYRRPPVRSDEYDGWEDDPVSVGHKLLGHVDLADDHATAIITREQWEKARKSLKEHSHEVKADDWPPINSKLVDGKTGDTTHVWDGENWAELPDGWTLLPDPDFSHEWRGPEDGLPPIGTEVQVAACDGKPLTYGEGESGPVVAHVEDTAVVRMSYGLGCFEADVLKPLKSDRDRWIEQACEAVETEAPEININIYCSYAIRKTIEVIYDAGLGKLKEEY